MLDEAPGRQVSLPPGATRSSTASATATPTARRCWLAASFACKTDSVWSLDWCKPVQALKKLFAFSCKNFDLNQFFVLDFVQRSSGFHVLLTPNGNREVGKAAAEKGESTGSLRSAH